MEIVLAKHAGFCMGVRRAVETTMALVEKGQAPIATFGPLIHNPQVLQQLEQQGVRVLKEVPGQASGIVVIRAHGVPPEQKAQLEASGATVEDVRLMRQHSGPAVQVKCAGGVRTLDDLLKMREAGATRSGATATEAILAEAKRRFEM